jgi:hypothetical protein
MTRDETLKLEAGREMDALIARTFKITPQGEYSTSLFWAIVLTDTCEGRGIMENVKPDDKGMISPLAICRAALLAVMEK